MKLEIDIEIADKSTLCTFSKVCLEGTGTSLCCEILAAKPLYLVVKPVSTFKSTNCAYRSELKNGHHKIDICSCPARLAIFEKYGS